MDEIVPHSVEQSADSSQSGQSILDKLLLFVHQKAKCLGEDLEM